MDLGRIEAGMDSNYEFLGLNLEKLMEMWDIWDKYRATEQVRVVQFFTIFLENYRPGPGFLNFL